MPNLPINIVQKELASLAGWQVKDNKLVKEFKFANFPMAIVFVNRLVNPSEEMDHHPGLKINYNRVEVELYTHTTGGITTKDLTLARAINAL